MAKVYLGIGSNLGDAEGRVKTAIAKIGQRSGIQLQRAASLYGSKPYGPVAQSDFVNTVIEINTRLEPLDLLNELKQLEKEMGRTHGMRWGPREIDLDILIFGDRKLSGKDLTLPHPEINKRAFVLAPLAELEPDWRLPDGVPIAEAIEKLEPGLVWLLRDPITLTL